MSYYVTGSMIDRRVVSCGSNAEKKQWVETLRQQAKQGPGHVPVKPENLQVNQSKNTPYIFRRCYGHLQFKNCFNYNLFCAF